VSVEDASADPPVSAVQELFGVPPGLVVGVAGALGPVFTDGVGTGDEDRVGVGDGVGAAVVGTAVGAGVRRTVSGPQAAATSEVSRKSPQRSRQRRVICLN
jgi:hypothetical protein